MLDQDDDDLRIVFGVIFGVIALVIGLVVGLGVHKLHRAKAPPAAVVMVEEAYAEVEPQGEALVKLYFAVGEAVLPADAAEALAKVKAAAAEKEGAIVLLSGFHDETGSAAVNAELAKNRALAVKAALVAAGMAGDKILLRKPAVTLGEGSPEEARRVEIRVQ
jgi:outer membrane protein OmpA-like peptidoglycan-associated protein